MMMEGRMEYFAYLRVMSESLKFKRISVSDSFARNSSQTLSGRFVFHAPTSFLTVPPLAFCLFNLSHSPSSQHTHTDSFCWLGLSEFHVVYPLMCLWVSQLSVKSSSSAFFFVNSVSYSKVSPHHGFLSYQNIQTFSSTSASSRLSSDTHSLTPLANSLFCSSPTIFF